MMMMINGTGLFTHLNVKTMKFFFSSSLTESIQFVFSVGKLLSTLYLNLILIASSIGVFFSYFFYAVIVRKDIFFLLFFRIIKYVNKFQVIPVNGFHSFIRETFNSQFKFRSTGQGLYLLSRFQYTKALTHPWNLF